MLQFEKSKESQDALDSDDMFAEVESSPIQSLKVNYSN